MTRKRIAILGSTGSIGKNACRVADALKDRIQVTALAANSNAELLAEQARHFGCTAVSIGDEKKLGGLKGMLPEDCRAFCGPEGLLKLVRAADVDMVLCAIVGTGGLHPVMEAVRAGKEIALASKEVLVMAGEPVMKLIREKNTVLIPVDSEHSAIFQCLDGLDSSRAEKLILTSSGGPFRKASREKMENATFEQALAHPVWSMGQKISIDSATLMNKALEMVEAHFLFDCPEEKIQVLVHPQSVIHSMVEFKDGAIMAQLGTPDMRLPIQYALYYPHRRYLDGDPLDFTKLREITFEVPDMDTFRGLPMAIQASREGGSMPTVFNAANELAVKKFLEEKIGFLDIYEIIAQSMERHKKIAHPDLDEILSVEQDTYQWIESRW